MKPTEYFKIPEEKHEEFIEFLNDLSEIVSLTHLSVSTVLERWEIIKRMKEEDPNYWHLNK